MCVFTLLVSDVCVAVPIFPFASAASLSKMTELVADIFPLLIAAPEVFSASVTANPSPHTSSICSPLVSTSGSLHIIQFTKLPVVNVPVDVVVSFIDVWPLTELLCFFATTTYLDTLVGVTSTKSFNVSPDLFVLPFICGNPVIAVPLV